MAWLKVFDNIYINLQHVIRIDYTTLDGGTKLVFYTHQGVFVVSKKLEISDEQARALINFLALASDKNVVFDIEKLVESQKAKEAQKC